MGNKTKAAFFTFSLSIVNSLAVTIFNLIYNQYLIRIYGSTINGLISTLTQFVSLFAIIEGGFTTAAVVATYSPIVKKEFDKLNDILYTVKMTYYKLGGLITLGVLIAGSIYIKFIDSPFSYLQTYTMLIISVTAVASSMCLLSKHSILLQGDNKEYILVACSLLAKTLTWILSMVLIVNGVHVIWVYSVNVLNVLVNVAFVQVYERKHFPYATYKGKFDKNLIKGTGDVLFQKIANTIFTSTDLVLISLCISLASASVYNLYYQIYRAILTFLSSAAQAPFNSFGQLASDTNGHKRMIDTFNLYQHLILVMSTIMLTITGVLIIPFVQIYTVGVRDVNYVNEGLAVLFFLQIFMQIINRPFGTILNATGNFRIQNIQCAVAAALNLIVSVVLIPLIGIHSIVLGSVVGTGVILVANICQAYRWVVKENPFNVIKNILINCILGIMCISISFKLSLNPTNYIQWVSYAIIVTLVVLVATITVNLLVDNRQTVNVIRYGSRIIKRKNG